MMSRNVWHRCGVPHLCAFFAQKRALSGAEGVGFHGRINLGGFPRKQSNIDSREGSALPWAIHYASTARYNATSFAHARSACSLL